VQRRLAGGKDMQCNGGWQMLHCITCPLPHRWLRDLIQVDQHRFGFELVTAIPAACS
jgi:hypothetical protein